MDELIWLLLDFLLELVGEMGLEAGRALDKENTSRIPALAFFLIVGLILGALSTFVFPHRVMRAGPFPGMSLVLAPALLGVAMELVGTARGKRRDISHLATWYGGAATGFALAAGRLGALTLMSTR